MLLTAPSSQLLLIDLQTRLVPALHEHALVLANARRLAQAAQLLRVPTSTTEQYPEGLGPTVPELAEFVREPLAKTCFSAVEAGLIDVLQAAGTPKASPNARSVPKHLQKAPQNQRDQIVIAGCEAHVCVLQTALGLLDEFDVCIVTDACGSRSERNRDAAYDRLASEGAVLLTTEMVLFEWLADAAHPHFKTIQGLIR
jgi:nicotinamidase-related amidase